MARFWIIALLAPLWGAAAFADEPFDNETLRQIEKRGRAVVKLINGRGEDLISPEVRFDVETDIVRRLKLVCGERLEFIVIDSDTANDMALGYLVPISEGGWEVGGWHRVTFSPNSATIKVFEPLSSGCLTFTKEKPNRRASVIEAYFATQILFPHPTENHVALSQFQARRVSVVTKSHIFLVQDGRIKVVGKL